MFVSPPAAPFIPSNCLVFAVRSVLVSREEGLVWFSDGWVIVFVFFTADERRLTLRNTDDFLVGLTV